LKIHIRPPSHPSFFSLYLFIRCYCTTAALNANVKCSSCLNYPLSTLRTDCSSGDLDAAANDFLNEFPAFSDSSSSSSGSAKGSGTNHTDQIQNITNRLRDSNAKSDGSHIYDYSLNTTSHGMMTWILLYIAVYLIMSLP